MHSSEKSSCTHADRCTTSHRRTAIEACTGTLTEEANLDFSCSIDQLIDSLFETSGSPIVEGMFGWSNGDAAELGGLQACKTHDPIMLCTRMSPHTTVTAAIRVIIRFVTLLTWPCCTHADAASVCV